MNSLNKVVAAIGLLCLVRAGLKAEDLPDLTITALKVDPAQGVVGRDVVLTAKVVNRGKKASGVSLARILVSTKSGQFTIGPLQPGKEQAIGLNFHISTPATYSALFRADAENGVQESDETNNEKSLVFTARAIVPPDLSVKHIRIQPAEPTTKDMIHFSAEIWNTGDEMTPVFNTSIQVGGESTPAVVPRAIVGPHGIAVARDVKLTEAGNYRVTFKADADNKVAESDESNNEGFLSFTVKPAKPDLTIREMTVTPANPTTQDTITFSAAIVNIGNLVAGAGKAGIRVGGESAPVLTYFPYVDNRPFRITRQLKLEKAGNYRVVFSADVEHKLDEFDEANNEGTLSFTVRAAQ